jgi:hypothetical protein
MAFLAPLPPVVSATEKHAKVPSEQRDCTRKRRRLRQQQKEQRWLGQYKAQRPNVENICVPFWSCLPGRCSLQTLLSTSLQARPSDLATSATMLNVLQIACSTRRDNRDGRALGNVAGSAPAFNASPACRYMSCERPCPLSANRACIISGGLGGRFCPAKMSDLTEACFGATLPVSRQSPFLPNQAC